MTVIQASFLNSMKCLVCAAALLGAGVNGIGRGLAPLAHQRAVFFPPAHLGAELLAMALANALPLGSQVAGRCAEMGPSLWAEKGG